jgi:hypothetical protein
MKLLRNNSMFAGTRAMCPSPKQGRRPAKPQKGNPTMTEDQIERHIEKCVDRYDAAFMARRIDQKAYDTLHSELNAWADNQYRLLAAAKLAG